MSLPVPADRMVRVLGVDLTAREGETSAAAILSVSPRDKQWFLEPPSMTLDSDAMIVEFAREFDVVALDGPRFPPRNFARFVAKGEQPAADVGRSRLCEREHARRVCPIFFSSPVATLGMQAWMTRSWSLFAELDQGPIEIFPMGGFVASLNGINKRRPHGLQPKTSLKGREQRCDILAGRLGYRVETFVEDRQGTSKAHDRVDAVMAAVTAAAFACGAATELGTAEEGTIVLPHTTGL